WHAGIVAASAGFPEDVSMELTIDEASYLRERVITSCPKSLLAFLLANHAHVSGAEFAWQLGISLPEHLAVPLKHAQNFSEVIHGAQLLYNLILAEQTSDSARIEEYRDRLSDWWELIYSRREQLMAWDQLQFWNT